MNTHRVVFDTNVLVSALLSSKGKPNKLYRMFLSGELVLIYNDDIVEEYKDVLYRPYLKIPQNEADVMLTDMLQHGEKVLPTPSTFEMKDEDDRIFYDTAKEARAYLITGNLKHYPNESHILNPAAFLGVIDTIH